MQLCGKINKALQYGQKPVHVTVSIVERNSSQLRLSDFWTTVAGVKASDWWVSVSPAPRVEDSDVVVSSDEGHDTGDSDSGFELFVHGLNAQEQEHGGSHHRSKRE